MTPRDRRAVLVGGGVIAFGVMVLRVFPAIARDYAALRARAAEWTATLARAEIALDAADARRDSLALAAREIVALAPRLVAGETAAAAAATLTAELSGAAERAGLRIQSLNAVPEGGTGAFRPVAVRAQFEGDVQGLAALLAALEGDRRVLSVRSLHVLAADPVGRQPGPELLRIDLMVVGWHVEPPRS